MPEDSNAESLWATFSGKVESLNQGSINKILWLHGSKCSGKENATSLWSWPLFPFKEAEFSLKVSKKKSRTRRETETYPGILSRMKS